MEFIIGIDDDETRGAATVAAAAIFDGELEQGKVLLERPDGSFKESDFVDELLMAKRRIRTVFFEDP